MDNFCWHCIHRDNFEHLVCGNCHSEFDPDGQPKERTFFEDRGNIPEQLGDRYLEHTIEQIVEKYPTMIRESVVKQDVRKVEKLTDEIYQIKSKLCQIEKSLRRY